MEEAELALRTTRARGRIWRERIEAIRPWAVLAERDRAWAVRQVGRDALSVAQVARELGVCWHTILAVVVKLGARLLANECGVRR